VATDPKADMSFMEQFEPDLFWQQHGKKVIAGLVAVAVIGLAALGMQRQKAAEEQQIAKWLAEANDIPSLAALANGQAGKEAGAQALLRMADLQYKQNQIAEATASYQRFLNVYPRHALAGSAQLGLAACLEAQGKVDGALAEYKRIVDLSPTGYASISARTGMARCLEAKGEFKQARQIYEELMSSGIGISQQTPLYLRWVSMGRHIVEEPTPPVTNSTLSVPPFGEP
jgi:tetratricopeptide (TPR) repeat protein